MSRKTAIRNLDLPEPVLLGRTLKAQKICVGATVLLALPGLMPWALLMVRTALPPAAIMSPSASLVALACAAGLAFSLPPGPRLWPGLLYWIGSVSIALALVALGASTGGFVSSADLLSLSAQAAPRPGAMTAQFAFAFLLIAILLLFVDAQKGPASYAADGLAIALCLVSFFLLGRFLFETTHIFPNLTVDPTPAVTVVALFLLTCTAVLVRAEYGAFRILLDRGMGGRIMRVLAPIVIVLPFLRELGRERLIRARLVPEHGAAALLSSITAVISLFLLVLITRYVHRMEKEIRELTLRDELTGLHNLRGFKLLAEQSLRLAQRSRAPFSLLFIDLDDLKQINDSFGHEIGSEFLIETAELLKESFRETDVIGRIGGDEFAIAGPMDEGTILDAARRLEEQASLSGNESRHGIALSLSIGHVTADSHTHSSLEELLAKADAMMYDRKRRKKLQVC